MGGNFSRSGMICLHIIVCAKFVGATEALEFEEITRLDHKVYQFGMAVCVSPVDSDISCTAASKNRTEQTPKWSDDKLKSLWSSLLNLELVSKHHEDLELQGILLLLETTFGIFKNLKKKCNEAEAACQIMKHNLESTKEDLYQVKEGLKRHKRVSCEHCPELEKELAAHRKKLEYNENCIKSIVSILSINNTSEDSDRNLQPNQKTAIDKAYNLVSQMLLESDNINLEKDTPLDLESGSKRLRLNSTENPQVKKPSKKRKKPKKSTGKANVLNIKDRESDTETLYDGASESVPANERIVCLNVEKEIVPETLCSQYPAKFSKLEKSMPEFSGTDQNEKINNIQTTPKKQMSQMEVTQKSSPILGGCSRKSTHKISHGNNYCLPVEDRPDDCPVPSQILILHGKSDTCVTVSRPMNNCEDDVDKSPSLLKNQSGMSNSTAAGVSKVEDNSQEKKRNKKHEENVSYPLEENQNNMNIQTRFWKLKPVPGVNVNNINPLDAGNRKLKQTTLSLASFSKKQDLCTFKEFNGGVRQSAFKSNLLAGQINGNCDEEMSLKLAIQESLNEKENTGSLSLGNKSPRIRNLRVDSAEDDDDYILASPNASYFRTSPRRKCVYARARPPVSRKGEIASSSASPKKQIHSAVGRKDMDETLFVPLYTSTLQDGTYGSREVTEEKLSSEQNFKQTSHPAEVKNRIESELVKKHDCSFDRIPDKVSTSPNYKYRRDALRKRDARSRLDGWECEQCRNYYAIANGGADPTELKCHLKQCSRHRDKYPVQSSTPPGFWNVNFPNTEESMFEASLTANNTPLPKD